MWDAPVHAVCQDPTAFAREFRDDVGWMASNRGPDVTLALRRAMSCTRCEKIGPEFLSREAGYVNQCPNGLATSTVESGLGGDQSCLVGHNDQLRPVTSPSLDMTRETCVLAVSGERTRCSAISWFDMPWPTSARISRSRGVSAPIRASSAGRVDDVVGSSAGDKLT